MSFTIRELELLSGIKAHTIRIWEQRYNFLKPSRTTTNIRKYSNEELKTLLSVALLNKYGFKISRIDQMKPVERNNAILQLPQEDAATEGVVNEMISCMVDLNNVAFEKILNTEITKKGFEETITGIIFTFLEKVGILWHTNRIVPLQEHIVSNIIRQKILSAIDRLPVQNNNNPEFLLFLPEDEHHEMGLMYVLYLLRKKNIPVLYLGANVPFKDLEYLFRLKTPPYMYLHLTSFPRKQHFNKFITSLTNLSHNSKVVISGSAISEHKVSGENIILLPSFKAVTDFIDSINNV